MADLQVPIGCAGVAVYPGDVIVGDADGLTVIPAHLAEEVAEYCSVQDDLENYLAMRIAAGEALWGVYPPSPATVAQYHAWIADAIKRKKLPGSSEKESMPMRLQGPPKGDDAPISPGPTYKNWVTGTPEQIAALLDRNPKMFDKKPFLTLRRSTKLAASTSTP